jgi:hypothetical protein
VPSEYDFDLLDAVIRHKFKTGPGSLNVRAGNYEYFKTKNSNDVLSRTTRLLPGTGITMAIIVGHPTLTDETCPMPGCGSIQTAEPPGGGRTWYVLFTLLIGLRLIISSCKCNVWFSPTEKRRQSLHDLLFAISALSDSLANEDQLADTRRVNKRAKHAPVEEDMGMFRNVRLSQGELLMESLQSPCPPSPFDYDFPGSLDTSNPPGHDFADHAWVHHNRNPHPSGFLDPTVDNDAKTTPLPTSLSGKESDEISKFGARGPVDFDHAMSYVNRIKRRFADQPSVYKQFLEILQAYQRESRPIQDVYGQVVNLFNSAPDLVEDFKQFLPMTATAHAEAQAAQTTSVNADRGGEKRKRD